MRRMYTDASRREMQQDVTQSAWRAISQMINSVLRGESEARKMTPSPP